MVLDKLLKTAPQEKRNITSPLFHPLSRRFHLLLLLMCGFCCTTFMRMQIALSVTCMVNSTAVALLEEEKYYGDGFNSTSIWVEDDALFVNSTISEGACQSVAEDGHQVVTDYGGTLVWTHNEQNIVFSGTFWGAITICLPAMMIVQHVSPRLVLLGALIIYIISSAFTPWLAVNFGYLAVFISRVIMGLGEGVVLPSINAIISNWFPINERSTALAIFTAGNQIAGAGGNPVAGALCASSLGWPAIFYLCAVAGSAWSVVWSLFSSSQPSDCKLMTKRERAYLAENVATRTKSSQKTQRVPYRKILTSPAFLAQFQCGIVINMIMTLLQIYLPTYLKDVLQLGVVANGAFLSLPNILAFVFKVIWSIVIDKMKGNGIVTPTTAVKISQGVANVGFAVGLFSAAFFVDCTRPGIAFLIFCGLYASMSTFVGGFYTSLLSLAPRYTFAMSSICQFGNMLGRLLTPFIVGMIKHSGTLAEWQTLFSLAAVVSLISGVIFLVFGSGEIQHWGRENPKSQSAPDLEEVLAAVQRTRSESLCV